MKKVLGVLLISTLGSCEYHDLRLKSCYLASLETSSGLLSYIYNNQNQLVSYTSPTVHSSTLSYNDAGKIILESDNQIYSIIYSYDEKNRLILWSQTVQNSPWSSLRTKFFYNSYGQDTLQQFYKYDVANSNFYLWRYARQEFSSTNSKNYSRIRTYDGATASLLYTEDFQWDSHPNPYLDNAFFINSPPPTNNITKYTYTNSQGISQGTDFSYVYNSNGFPVERRIASTNSTVAIYTYTNCQ